MRQTVNYITHHKSVNDKFIESTLNSSHISLYNALFLIWNNCGFDTDLSINRNDVMKLSKIGSANTYTKCLKDLDKEGFLKYLPSFNPLIGSKINMYRFDKGTDKGTDKGIGVGSGNSTATLSKQLNKETIKLININVDLVNDNLKEWISELSKTFKNKEQITKEDIDFIYSLYPTKCIVKNNPTGKSTKDKEKIKSLIPEHGKEGLEKIIHRYVKECKNSKTYMKNFKTFLNNLPDYSEVNNTDNSIIEKILLDLNLPVEDTRFKTLDKLKAFEKSKKWAYDTKNVSTPWETYLTEHLKVNL